MNMSFDPRVAIRVEVKREFPETTEYQDFVREITKLRLRVKELQADNTNMGWQLNPDRMGGSFSRDEIDNTGWK